MTDQSSNPASLIPRRNPGLISRIWSAITKATPDIGPQPSQQDTTQSGTTAYSVQSLFDQYFRTEIDRLSTYKDVDEMDEQSEETSVVLDTIADNVCTSEDGSQVSFDVVCEDVAAQKVIEEMMAKCDLHMQIYSLARNTIKYGDSFSEIIVNGEMNVVGLRQLPPSTMRRNQDMFGNLKMEPPKYDKDTKRVQNKSQTCAFEQINPETQNLVATFFPWQIAHTRFNHDGFSPYGKSLLRVTRVIWRKMLAEEEALIIGRLTRAYLKLVYHVDTTGLSKSQKLETLQFFKDQITQRQALDGRRENPNTVMTDIFLADGYVPTGMGERKESRTRVELIDPRNEGLSQIADIEYFHKKKLSTLRVPPAHMGFEKDVNAKATLTMQDVQYVRFLRRFQSLLSQTVEQVIDTTLILQGMDPEVVDYKIKWPELSAANQVAASLAEYQRAQADTLYQTMGAIDTEWVQRHRYGMTDEEIVELAARVEEEKQEELAQQQQQADMQHQNQLELVKAQGQNGTRDNANGVKNRTPSKSIQSRAPRAVGQEVTALAQELRSRTEKHVQDEMDKLKYEKALFYAEAKEALTKAGEPTQLEVTLLPDDSNGGD